MIVYIRQFRMEQSAIPAYGSGYLGPGPVTVEIDLVAEGSEGFEDLRHHGPFVLEPLDKARLRERQAPPPAVLAPVDPPTSNTEVRIATLSPAEAEAEADQERMHRMTTPYEDDYQWSGCPDCNTKPCCCSLPELF